MRKNTKKPGKKRVILTPQQKAENLLKRNQESEIRGIFKNLGFTRIPNIDGKNINYDGRSSEMDDIFVCENLILITEYTIAEKPGSHIKNKIHYYNKIVEDKRSFINFLNTEPKLSSFKKYYDDNISSKYTLNHLKVEIIYCSRFNVSQEHRDLTNGVVFFDYHLVQYFKSLTKVIKKSAKYEFCDFLKLPFEQFGENILGSTDATSNKYHGHILPEEKSKFKDGYKIVSFYIDANSLMRRSYVLRQEGWRDRDGIGYYQRMFEPKKISNMRKYLSDKERVFVNNIIATISESKIKLFDETGVLEFDDDGQFVNASKIKVTPTRIQIEDECNIIGLIDGQHRTYAYHEGDDAYEPKIKALRDVQNLLVTGIIFPNKENDATRRKFEANLFLEINSNQSNVRTQLKQEIELMITPFSTTAISKRILQKLNENGSFEDLIEQYSFDKGKLKTSSIVSFGLKPLIKLDEKSPDSLFTSWSEVNKLNLKIKDSEDFTLVDEYVKYCVETMRELFIAVKNRLNNDQWHLYSHKTQNGLLNVTFFNGLLNVLRLLIENNKLNNNQEYFKQLEDLKNFPFRTYKSSQYRKMGEDIYKKFFK